MLRRLTIAAVACALVSVPHARAQEVRHDGEKAVRVTVSTQRELMTALALTDDVWSCGGVGIGSFIIRQTPEQLAGLVRAGIPHEVLDWNIQAAVDGERARLARGGGPLAAWFDEYKNYDALKAQCKAWATANPTLAKYSVLGKTLQQREIFALRITGPGDPSARPAVMFIGTQHAREWVSPMTVMYIADRLLSGYASDPNVKSLLDNAEFILVPVVNADGYVHSWSTDRYWRKNRRDNAGTNCEGVDTNRNWGYKWGLNIGSSPDPCSEAYRGTAAFSEPEPLVIANYVKSNPRIGAFIDFHSFSQLILSPWGWTSQPPPDHAEFQEQSSKMAAAIYKIHGMTYAYGPGYTTIYPTSGTAPDWSYGARGIFGWTIELRDTGQYGFVLPPNQIIPTGQETFAAVLSLGDWVHKPLKIALPKGVPDPVAPNVAAKVQVSIENAGDDYLPGSGKIFRRIGPQGAFTGAALKSLGGAQFEGTLLAAPCGSLVQFYIEAKTTTGKVVTLGSAAVPKQTHAADLVVAYDDRCEQNLGWLIGDGGDTATSGVWNRKNPEGTAAQPEDDHTASPGAWCWVTDGVKGQHVNDRDVDNGSTTITSPKIAALSGGFSGTPSVYLTYWRWYSNSTSGNPNSDSMPVYISADNGFTWKQLELVTENAGKWVQKTFKLNDFITPSNQVRLRFVARDQGGDSAVEAAIDDVKVWAVGCKAPGPVCNADCDQSGTLDVDDFICFQTRFSQGDGAADCDGSGTLDIDDFICFQTAYGLGCP